MIVHFGLFMHITYLHGTTMTVQSAGILRATLCRDMFLIISAQILSYLHFSQLSRINVNHQYQNYLNGINQFYASTIHAQTHFRAAILCSLLPAVSALSALGAALEGTGGASVVKPMTRPLYVATTTSRWPMDPTHPPDTEEMLSENSYRSSGKTMTNSPYTPPCAWHFTDHFG